MVKEATQVLQRLQTYDIDTRASPVAFLLRVLMWWFGSEVKASSMHSSLQRWTPAMAPDLSLFKYDFVCSAVGWSCLLKVFKLWGIKYTHHATGVTQSIIMRLKETIPDALIPCDPSTANQQAYVLTATQLFTTLSQTYMQATLGVQLRDFRILDPTLSEAYPPCILCRDSAIVVNLLNIKVRFQDLSMLGSSTAVHGVRVYVCPHRVNTTGMSAASAMQLWQGQVSVSCAHTAI